ncbi:glucodextranase DOMON-like domain-containing protein [Corallococcus sp. CA053C]|uniref:glucodextranase DOMON-like domain-containing protein n=1 Tax=Corallococcus sp. CA053C TaxID=2316732 RepID=UPI001315A8A6|nr:glucodextranase DOMON-like domain-containing protein [Corallococcus sp. CA053C]
MLLRRRGLSAFLLATTLSACSGARTHEDALLFRLEDPTGDDHGDGELVYPRRPDLGRGDLDVVAVAAFAEEGATRFEVTFAHPIAKPSRAQAVDIGGSTVADRARHGFYTFNVDLYVDTDRVTGSGRTDTLPGRQLTLAPDSAWEKAVVLTPRPYEAREALRKHWREGTLRAYEQKTGPIGGKVEAELNARAEAELAAQVFFPTLIQVSGRTVMFQVPDSFLGQHAQKDWGYGVAVTGASIDRRVSLGGVFGGVTEGGPTLMAMDIAPGEPLNDRFGGGRKGDPSQSPVVDLLVRPGDSQEAVLGPAKPAWSTVVPSGRAAAVPEVAPAAAPVEDAGGPEASPAAPVSGGAVEPAPSAGDAGSASPSR